MQSSHLFSPSISFHLTSQVHRVWRVQRELLRDESRLDTLRPLQEQSVLIGCPASCEWHKSYSSPTVPLSSVFLALFSHHCCYLSQKQISLFHGFPETLAAYWVTKADSKGGIFREQLLLISSIWRFPLWLMCLGWWRSDPTQIADSSLSLNKPLSTIPINAGPGPCRPATAPPAQTVCRFFCSVDNDKQANTPWYTVD